MSRLYNFIIDRFFVLKVVLKKKKRNYKEDSCQIRDSKDSQRIIFPETHGYKLTIGDICSPYLIIIVFNE